MSTDSSNLDLKLSLVPRWVSLYDHEQLYLDTGSERKTINGPKRVYVPLASRYQVRTAQILSLTEYVVKRNETTGKLSVAAGPGLVFLAADEGVVRRGDKVNVSSTQYLRVENRESGKVTQVQGPVLFCPCPFDDVSGPLEARRLSATQYLHVKRVHTGEVELVTGPALYFPAVDEVVEHAGECIKVGETQFVVITNSETGQVRNVDGPSLIAPRPHERVRAAQEGTQLGTREFAYVKNTRTGVTRSVRGPALLRPAANEAVGAVQRAIAVQKNHYLRIVDEETGKARVVRGEALVYLAHTESLPSSEPLAGIHVDQDRAVVVRSLLTGQLHLVTDPQVFIPSADEVVVREQPRIRLEEYHTCVIKDQGGGAGGLQDGGGPDCQLIFRQGPCAFFLKPHQSLMELSWSTGLHKDSRDLAVSLFDSRAYYMSYSFDARTKDNVVLQLTVTFFWALCDVRKMVKTTSDAPGDLCAHARSCIIQKVSQQSLEDFLASFNATVQQAVLQNAGSFFEERGIHIREVQVRSVSCVDSATQGILQEIIKENTNRINRLQVQESENEVALKKFQGEIEAERMRGELLAVRQEHARKEGAMAGELEGARVASFMLSVADVLTDEHVGVDLFKTLRKQEALIALAEKEGAQLFFTPADVDLQINTAR